ncbi:MAG TPA: hypothetical protein VFI13_09600, partial [Gemmatimonadales bacterium]|nr:hypothetical protein [Gemmatimonadales bacterium]
RGRVISRRGRAAMSLSEDEERQLRTELERIRPRLAGVDQAEQERLLDEAFARAGLDPDWATWLAWASLLLPAHRQRNGCAGGLLPG